MADAKTYLNTFLSEVEQEALVQFNANPLMFHAVKKVLLAGLYQHGTLKEGEKPDFLRNATLAFVANQEGKSNEDIGADLRAYWQGLNSIESGFGTIETYKEVTPPSGRGSKNPAR